ncbi:uncharacterized protein LOC141531565 [Cotesia typhae]|uniref:uncharacterized protein LOC141531565 n=1 Tax=Cotesia typhae TaxID=2053667 RepID=UPI003D68D0EE
MATLTGYSLYGEHNSTTSFSVIRLLDSLNKLLSDIQEVTEVRTTNDNIGEKSFHLLSAASSTPIALKSKDENSKNNIISLEESIEFCKFGISQLNRKIKTLDALFDNTEKLRLYKDEFECLQNELSTSRSDEQSLNQLDKQLSNKNLDEKMDLTKISHDDLSEKIHSLLNNVVGSGSFIEELGYGYNQEKEALSTAKKDINSLRKKSERIEHDTVALRNHNESLKAEILVFNKQLNENNNHMKSMNKILELLKMKLHDKQTHSDDLQSNFHDYKSKIKSLMTEFYILKKEIENLKKYHDIKEVKLNNTKIAEDGLFTVKNELTELTQKWDELISSIDYLKKQTEDSKNCNLILNNQLERVKSIINNLRMENDLNFKTKKLDVRFETVQTNNEEQKKLNYELAKRSLGADEEYDEPKKEVTRSPAEFSKKTKDISPKSSLQDELEIFRSNNVNLEETIETSMVDNNHLREELAKIQNDMSTLEVKSNKSLMVNDELIDKVKLIIHEDASFNKKVDWLHHYDNVDIESRHEEKLLIHDSLPTETQIFELGSKDINDLIDNSMINNTNVNKLLNEVELDDKDTFDVEVADQSFDNVKIQQETLKKLQKRNIVSHNNSEIIKTDLQMRQNENRNSNKINPRTNESIIGMKTKDNAHFTSNKVESKQQLQGNISLKENNDVPNSGQRHVKTERQKSLRKQNHEILSTSLKEFDHESSIKNYGVNDENVFDKFHQFIYKNMKKHFEGLSCINDIILDMNNQKSQKESKTMLLNNDDLTVFDISNPLLKKIAQLSVDILNNITYIIRNLTEVNEMLKNYLKENLQLKMTLLKDTVLGIPTSLRENMLKSKEWLEPLTLTHLADIHEKICLMASKVVTEDEDLTSFTFNKIYSSSKCLNKCDRECEIMSPRVTALQRKIFELQKQTCDKVLDIQKAIEHRKTGLDEISKIIKCERQRNYTSYPIDNASSLTPNICVTKCAEKEKFIQIIQWEKQ